VFLDLTVAVTGAADIAAGSLSNLGEEILPPEDSILHAGADFTKVPFRPENLLNFHAQIFRKISLQKQQLIKS
jgi:hypothetical protein